MQPRSCKSATGAGASTRRPRQRGLYWYRPRSTPSVSICRRAAARYVADMDDLEALVDELVSGAEGRGPQVLDAAFPGDPRFVRSRSTSIAEALDPA